MKYLNLGCGTRHHPDWINIDLLPRGPGVLVHDLSRRLPFDEGSFEVVYHSHFLEHLPRSASLPLMRECYRVLKPKGILRVVLPDLERICRLYLQKLDDTLSGQGGAAVDYEWMMLEMYDQAVRDRAGGEMIDYLSRRPVPNEAFVCSRIGEEARELLGCLRNLGGSDGLPPPSLPGAGHGMLSSTRQLLHRSRERIAKMVCKLLLGTHKWKALQVGGFRLKGEVHQWMYDRYSLSDLLLRAGFQKPMVVSATQSQIPNWASFHLDTLPDGTTIRPDSLFMEALKPGGMERVVDYQAGQLKRVQEG